MERDSTKLVYTKWDLLALRKRRAAGMRHPIPGELRRKYRGCRAGASVKTGSTNSKRRRYKPSVPSILMGNVNALQNKVDELAGLMKTQKFYRESSLIVLTETWLTSYIPDANVELSGFMAVRADRDTKTSSKSKGGGLILYTNNRWCNPSHLTVKDTLCCRYLELLAVSMRPYYLPREFTQVIAVCVYIPPRADAGAACETIHQQVHDYKLSPLKLFLSYLEILIMSLSPQLWLASISLWTVQHVKTGPLT